MRWFVTLTIAFAFLLVGWNFGQRSQDGEETAKLADFEKRLAEAEKKIAELERRVAELSHQVKQLRTSPPVIVPPQILLERLTPFRREIPEEWHGFGLPKPAPQPFVQPYYYPLAKQH